MNDATERFEIETVLKAGLPKARVAEIAGASVHWPKCPVNCATGALYRTRAEEAESVGA